jgi:ubiquinone/menaquinone biosynthesis C-methylase UbiE
MKKSEDWKPSKYVYINGKLRASNNINEIGIGSKLIANLLAEAYDSNLRHYAKNKLLDLGCGKVPLYEAYKDFVSEIVCLDWGNSLHGNVHLDHECDLTQPLPFNDEEFDTIILSDVLEHIPQPEKLWAEMTRILAPDGKIIMNVPFYYCIHEQPYDYYRYTSFALERFVQISGLHLIKLCCLGGALEVMADVFSKNICNLPLLGNLIASYIQWFTFSIRLTKFGKLISERTQKRFPLGYFLVASK